MLKINRIQALKIILFGSMINAFIFNATGGGSGIIRLISMLFMNLSSILLLIFFFKIAFKNFDTNTYFKVMFFLLISWCFITVFRALSLNPQAFITVFGHFLIGWAWMSPLAVVFGFNIFNWIMIFDFISTLSLIGSILTLGSPFYSMNFIFGISKDMVFLPILFMTSMYHNKRNKRIAYITLLAFIINSIFSGQRANLGLILMIISFMIFEFYRQKEVGMYKKISVLFGILIFMMLLLSQVDKMIEKVEGDEDAQTDTRTFLFVELFADLEPYQLIIGKGASGTYYSPYFEYTRRHGLGGDNPNRMANEVGYLQMILKGGIIMMALHLLILLPAAYLGIFASRNIITRACGYYIVIYLLLWMINSYAIYSAEFLLLWMAAGTIVSTKNRKLKNSDLLIKIKKGYEFEKR